MNNMKLFRAILRLNNNNHHHHRNHHHHHRNNHHFRHLTSFTNSTPSTPPRRLVYTFNLNATTLRNHPSTQFYRFSSEPTPSQSNAVKCWNCSSGPTSDLFLVCNSCGCIQPTNPSHDYFRIFSLDKKFDIEEGSLEGKYKDWQKKLHPDLVHSKSEREKEYAADQSSRVIDAYKTLSDPLSRAIYLMKLHGIHVDEEQTVSDPDLLAEVMELRESVEEAASSQTLNQIHTQVHEKIKEWTESFARAFNSEDMDDALNAIRRITYYKRATVEIVKRL